MQRPSLEKECPWENRMERNKVMKSQEKVSGEQSLSVCCRRAKTRLCEIIREPGTTFSCCGACCHMMLWEPYGTAQRERRQTQRWEIALVGTELPSSDLSKWLLAEAGRMHLGEVLLDLPRILFLWVFASSRWPDHFALIHYSNFYVLMQLIIFINININKNLYFINIISSPACYLNLSGNLSISGSM